MNDCIRVLVGELGPRVVALRHQLALIDLGSQMVLGRTSTQSPGVRFDRAHEVVLAVELVGWLVAAPMRDLLVDVLLECVRSRRGHRL